MIGLLGLLWACGAPTTPTAEPPAASPPSAATVEPNTPGPSADDPCVEACKRNNMARAVSIEIIESDCEKACSGDPPAIGIEAGSGSE